MIGSYYGNLLGSSITNLNNIDRTPYDVPGSISGKYLPTLLHANGPFGYVGNAFILNCQISLLANLGRMGWNASRSIGLTSSLRKPFNVKRQMWGPNAIRGTGFIADSAAALEDFVNKRVFNFKYARAVRKLDMDLVKSDPHLMDLARVRDESLASLQESLNITDADIAGKERAWAKYRGDLGHRLSPGERRKWYREWSKSSNASLRQRMKIRWGMRDINDTWNDSLKSKIDDELTAKGMMPGQKRFDFRITETVSKKDLRNRMLDPDAIFKPVALERYLIKPRRFHNMLEEVIGSRPLREIGSREQITSRYLKHMYGNQEGFILKRKFRSWKDWYRTDKTAYVRAQQEHYVSLRNLAFGRKDMTRGDMVGKMLSGERRFTLRVSRSRTNARIFNQSMKFVDDLQKEAGALKNVEFGYAGTGEFLSDLRDIQKFGHGPRPVSPAASHFMQMGNRLSIARAMKFATFATVGVTAGAMLARSAFKTVNQTMARFGSTMNRLTAMDFGSGEVLMNSRLATERQRAIEAISNAQLNARYLLGNEASLYHY